MKTQTANVLMAQPVQTTQAKMSLTDFYSHGMSLSKLKDGVYDAKLQAHSLIVPTDPGSQPYVRLELALSDRVIIDNRFEIGFPIALDHIKEQLGMSELNIPVCDLLDSLRDNGTALKIWVSYAELDGKTYRNINYLPPRATAQPNTQSAETAAVIDGKDF